MPKTTKLDEILNLFDSLGEKERQRFLLLATSAPSRSHKEGTIEDFLRASRFKDGKAFCVHCHSGSVKRNGTKGGRQRFYCKSCGKSFSYATGTIFNGAKKGMDTFGKYLHCMMDGTSVRKTARECGMTKNNAFYLRHRILDALGEMQDGVRLSGIVEADETFFHVSFKGNHSKSPFSIPRGSHHRGTPAKHRGLSRDLVCVPCAVTRNGLSIARISNLGRASYRDLSNAFSGRVEPDSVLCTDRHSGYVRFARMNDLNLLQVKSERHIGIQNINSYHSRLKRFLRPFNGVATKYLNNYLVWHNLVNYARGDAEGKEAVWKGHNASARYKGSRSGYAKRSPVPLLRCAA